jgi:hypothetical protein
MKIPIMIGLLLILTWSEAQAWGPVGHKTTALIAEAYLSPQAAAEVKDLLEGQRLVDVANWADSLRDRPEYAHTRPYHYQESNSISSGRANLNVYRENLLSLSPRQRWSYRPGVVEAIEACEETLADSKAVRSEKQAALKFLVHFVGDLHQPLHTGLARNRGGNPIQVDWQGTYTNLHKVWDSEIIYDRAQKIPGSTGWDPSWKYAQWLLNANANQLRQTQNWGDASQWYQESLSYQNLAYDRSYESDPSAYEEQAGRVIDQRLLLGGRRLADVLNRIFANGQSRTTLAAAAVIPPDQTVIQFAEKILGSMRRLVSLDPQNRY